MIKKRILLVFGALLGALFNDSKSLATPTPQTRTPPDDSNPIKLNISQETLEALRTLISHGNLIILPSGKIQIKSMSIDDLKNLGLTFNPEERAKTETDRDIHFIDLDKIEAENDSGSRTVTSL
jgi:hypothetical protein